jgi:hypothetical protein
MKNNQETPMPSPSTTDLPRPRSWEEFEDICADVLERMWNDPYVTRNGRQGQQQNGVDIYGEPAHLNGTYAGAQCKKTDSLDIQDVKQEFHKAQDFRPPLAEYLILTTARQDARLQQEVREHPWPIRVEILFWEKISLELSGYEDLLAKHFPDWMKRVTSKDDVLTLIQNARPEDFDYDDETGRYIYTKDLQLWLELERNDLVQEDRLFHEPWVEKFPDPIAYRQPVHIIYAGTRIKTIYCASVDGSRYLIPYPKSHQELIITPFQYKLSQILNFPFPGYEIDLGLGYAGITVQEEDEQ